MTNDNFGTRLLLLLTSQGLLNSEQASQANDSGVEPLEKYLLEQNWVTRVQLAEVAAQSFGVEAHPSPHYMDGVLSQAVQRRYRVFPIKDQRELLTLAAASPGTTQCVSEITQLTGKKVQFKIVDRLTLQEHLNSLDAPSSSAPKLEVPAPRKAVAVDPPSESTITVPGSAITSELLIAGRYRKLSKLVDGRFSTLFEGRDEGSGAPVTIRHLEAWSHLHKVGQKEKARVQTLREGRVLSRLNHPGLPRVRNLVQHDDDIYLVGDELKGETLLDYVTREGPLEPELVRRYFLHLLQVLRYLHNQDPSIIHRDLRPQTVLVTPHGSLSLAEFGLAKMEQEATSSTEQTAFRSYGDPVFAAPEQLMGEASRPQNDLYSAGALAYFMACGKPPSESLARFGGKSIMAPLPPELDLEVRQSIEACLNPKLESRPTTAGLLLEKLETREVRLPLMAMESQAPAEMQQDDGVEGSDEATPVPEAAPKKRSMWQLIFGGKDKQTENHLPTPDPSVKEKQLAGIPFADLASMDLDREVCSVLPEGLCRTINGICIGTLSEREITVACKDPTDVHIYDQINIGTKGRYTATLMRADESLIDHAIEFIYRGDHLGPETRWSKYLDLKKLHDVTLETVNEQANVNFGDEALEGPVVEAVDRLIKEAIAAEASDIHLEPFDTGMDIRYRIDGVLRRVAHYERQVASAIVKRIKVMANMDIAQERVTQGGRISLKVGSGEYDLRVSIVPVPVGESVVMRILKKGAFTLTLADLGFSEEKEFKFRRILSQPHGMILVCGPTGSGKSTTLYASLKEIQRPDRKLLTAEDPIEYQMPGIIQVQMNTAPKEEEKKVTFSKTLREFLRQDPDVILVGEIRDTETAEIGIQAALTGHLLLSTLHTNDSVGIIARLRDMDCEPFQIGSVLLGGLAQRLARRICQNCRHQVPVPEEMRHLFVENGIENPKMYKGRGCRKCHQSGHRGRVGLYELLEITPEIRAHINRGDHEEEIRKTAESQGFKNLLSDGLEKVCQGYVTLEEVLRVCKTF